MIKIDSSVSVQTYLKNKFQNEKTNTQNSLSLASNPLSPAYSDAISSYGKAQIAFKGKIGDEIANNFDKETISLEDAIAELSKIKSITPKKMVDYIMASTYETDSPELVISKKAILCFKENLVYGSLPPKFVNAVRTCLDEENQSFNELKFDNMFNCDGKIKISAKLKPFIQKLDRKIRDAHAQKKLIVFNTVQNSFGINPQEVKVSINQNDLFTPIKDVRDKLLVDLDSLKEKSEISDDLYKALKGRLDRNNFNLQEAYESHYALLADCKSLDEVKELYPDIKFPDRPVYNPTLSRVTLNNRLVNEDYDAISLDIIKRLYLDLELPNQAMLVELPNEQKTTNMFSMTRAGLIYSTPAEGLQKLLKDASEIEAKYKAIEKMDFDELHKFVNKNAVYSARIWDDYNDLTKKHWFPIKLINSKEKNPEVSKYRTDKLVNTYLYELYKSEQNKTGSKNPLAKFDDKKHLSPEIFRLVNSIYITRYKEDNIDTKYLDPNFQQFKKGFDQEAIGKSIENMEKLYKNVFFSQYWTPERVSKLKEQLQISYDIVFEKIGLSSNNAPKIVTDEDVNEIVSKEMKEFTPKINVKDIGKFKFMTANIQDKTLEERCQSCISDTKMVDIGYFNTMFNIIENSFDEKNGQLDENKAKILIYFHDKYMSEILSSDTKVNEEEYIKKELIAYTDKNGNIDFAKADNDIIEPLMFEQLSLRMIDAGNDDIIPIIEEKFLKRNDGADYTMANTVLNSYFAIPDFFKALYLNKLKEVGHTNKYIIFNETQALFDTISSWNFDNDEEIIMDKDSLPQKIVIEQKAKQDLWEMTGNDVDLYDSYWKSFCKAAERRTGEKGGTGIKSMKKSNTPYRIELKILGKSKSLRMYPREVTPDDKLKYEKEDGIKLKYIFSSCGYHL